LSSLARQVLGLELEGLSPEDREFKAIRQFVRFAGETMKNVGEDSKRTNPHEMAHRAAAEAARLARSPSFIAARTCCCRLIK
jgi:hypothetical protein